MRARLASDTQYAVQDGFSAAMGQILTTEIPRSTEHISGSSEIQNWRSMAV